MYTLVSLFGIFTALFCCIMVVVFIVAIVDEHFMVKVFEVVAVVKVADAIIFCVCCNSLSSSLDSIRTRMSTTAALFVYSRLFAFCC
tara:strand:- start:144 stop:404 length:261 start_codon:yes stop_codon:yes gene_type:complete